MINVGIIGGAGYTAGELVRILLRHPEVSIRFVHSNSQSGKPVHATHTDLTGDTELVFQSTIDRDVDVYFLCQGHGKSIQMIADHPFLKEKVIIDMSRDYRLTESGNSFVYGLPELQKQSIRKSKYIANPGCFATAIQLALLPLASSSMLRDEIHLHGITGSTGAGQSPMPTTHFSWRSNNVSVYKAFNHQHLGEVVQSIRQLQPAYTKHINFVPIRGNFSRGIFISGYVNIDESEDHIKELYRAYYLDDPFTHVSEAPISLKSVVNTNKCLLHLQKHDNKLHVISIIDNLLKGASGQAVQNMNLAFGLPEDTGLHLKANLF